MPGLPATALWQDRTGFAEPRESNRPATRHCRRAIPVDLDESDLLQIFIEPMVGDLQQCQIDLGRLITYQRHLSSQSASFDGAHQQLLIIADVAQVVDVVR